MPLENFQKEIKVNFANGSGGAFVASLVWLASAVALQMYGIKTSFAVLFFGGMLIFPLSVVFLKVILKRSADSKGNLGGMIVIETIPPMIIGFFAAWLLMPHNPELVMPIATLAVGAHYFGFRSAYGENAYLALAIVVCGIAFLTIFTSSINSLILLYLVAAIELLFGFILLKRIT